MNAKQYTGNIGEVFYEGSSKNLRHCDEKTMLFEFTDGFSAFDVGRCPQLISGKGAAVCSAAVKSFLIAASVGVKTHFIEQVADNMIRVMRVNVITDRPIGTDETDFLFGRELIRRYYVAGGLLRDMKAGKAKPMDYGFESNDVPAEGTMLPWAVSEVTTKWEKEDRKVFGDEICAGTGFTPLDLQHHWDGIGRIDGAMALAWYQAGFGLWDGKYEVGLVGPSRQPIILDVFGTQDENRPVSLDELAQGQVVHYGKEYLRQYLIQLGYYDEVKTARAQGFADPSYPTIPKWAIDEASYRYSHFAARYAAIAL
ncbi:MAG: phosphoribosylaminoimidazolesuccinocarboxamide synthase [Patescibacteria group bacterium]